MKLASRNAIDFLVRTQNLSPEDGYQFLSLVGDFVIAEAVNGIKNVTVHIPKDLFAKRGKTTLCAEGTFPLQPPNTHPNGTCVPQEGKMLE
jgi:hypothetical protein